MQIEVNGAPTECAEHATLAQLVSDLGYGDQRIAVEHNGQIVPREHYPQTMIGPGDTLVVTHPLSPALKPGNLWAVSLTADDSADDADAPAAARIREAIDTAIGEGITVAVSKSDEERRN